MITPLLSLLAPHECVGCSAEGLLLCAACTSQQVPAHSRCPYCHAPWPDFAVCSACQPGVLLEAVYSCFAYAGEAKDLVWKLKFGRAKAAADEMGRLMAGLLPVEHRRPTIVTHAPTATSRVRQRGYDQAALLAKTFGRMSGLPYAPLLVRLGQRKQVGASREVRQQQTSHSFRPTKQHLIRGAHIIIVDDVVTTGSTLESAAKVLSVAGAESVRAVTFAQA